MAVRGRCDVDCLLLLSRLQSFLWRGVEDPCSVDEAGVGVQLKTETGEVEVLDVEVALGGDGLVGEKVAKYGQDRLAVGTVREVLLEGRVGLRNYEVVGVRS